MDLNATIRSLIHDRGGLNKTPISFRLGKYFMVELGGFILTNLQRSGSVNIR